MCTHAREPADSQRFDAFISHDSSDAEWVGELTRDLQSRGVLVWLDQHQIRPGDRFVSKLAAGLEASRCVLVVVSQGMLGANESIRTTPA